MRPIIVAPFMGAWIEMSEYRAGSRTRLVAPFMGAWIEIAACLAAAASFKVSHPSWVRGLKWPSMTTRR